MKKILLCTVLCFIALFAKSEDLTKLTEKQRVKRLTAIAKKVALEYGDERYWVDGAEYEIKIWLKANRSQETTYGDVYEIKFTNEFAKKNMEYGYLVSVQIETTTGKIGRASGRERV